MSKLTPLFLVLAAFFLLSIAIGISYERASAKKLPSPKQVVLLESDHADPSMVIVKIGEIVRFVPQDNIVHHLAGTSSATKFDSGKLGPRDSYQLAFKQAGTYDVADTLHPKIFVKVIVIDPAK